MGIFRRNTAPEPSLNTAPGDEWFFDASNPRSQDAAQQHESGYDQSAPPSLTVVEHPNGALTWSNGVPLPDDAANSYWLIKRNQQTGGGSYTDDSSASYPGQNDGFQETYQEYPNKVVVTVRRSVTYEGEVGDPRYLGVASQAVADQIARDNHMQILALGQQPALSAGSTSAPVEYRQEQQTYLEIDPRRPQSNEQYYPQGSPYVPEGYSRLQDQDEFPMDNQLATDQEQEIARHNSVKRSPKLIKVAGSLVLAAVTAYGVHGGLSWMPFYGPEHQIQKSDFLKNEAAFWSSIGEIAGGK